MNLIYRIFGYADITCFNMGLLAVLSVFGICKFSFYKTRFRYFKLVAPLVLIITLIFILYRVRFIYDVEYLNPIIGILIGLLALVDMVLSYKLRVIGKPVLITGFAFALFLVISAVLGWNTLFFFVSLVVGFFIGLFFCLGLRQLFRLKKIDLRSAALILSNLLLLSGIVIIAYSVFIENIKSEFVFNMLAYFYYISIAFLIYFLVSDKKIYPADIVKFLKISLALLIVVFILAAFSKVLFRELIGRIFIIYIENDNIPAYLNTADIIANIYSFLTSIFILTVFLIFFINALKSKYRLSEINGHLAINDRIFEFSANPALIFKDGMLISANQSACAFLGYKEQDLLFKKFDDLFSAETLADRKSVNTMLFSPSAEVTINALDSSGKKIPCVVVSSAFNYNARYNILNLYDISQFKEQIKTSRFINNIFSILIEDNLWQEKIKLLFNEIHNHFKPKLFYMFIQSYEGFYNCGNVTDPVISKKMRNFYFNLDSNFKLEKKHPEYWVFIKIRGKSSNYGAMVFIIPEEYFYDDIISDLKSTGYIISQFIESSVLLSKLKNSEETYRILVESSFTGIFIIQDNLIKYANQKLSTIMGYDMEEILNGDWFTGIVDTEFRDEVLKSIDNIIESGEGEIESFIGYTKQGKKRWFRAYGSCIEYAKKPAVLVHITDITDEVEAEKQRQKMTNLLIEQRKTNTLKHLVTGISHEFNNVFAIIKGYTELLSYDGINKKFSEDIKIISDAIRRGIKITNRMHIFARHEKMSKKPLNLVEFLKYNQPFIQNLIRKRDGDFRLSYDVEDGLPLIDADEFNLEEILHNLALNSLDAFDKSGSITIKAFRLDDDYVELDFIDDGEGIQSEYLDNIFDPFFTTKDPDKGTGLGLFIVYQLMQSMDGRAEIESYPGKGTTIKLIFPVAV